MITTKEGRDPDSTNLLRIVQPTAQWRIGSVFVRQPTSLPRRLFQAIRSTSPTYLKLQITVIAAPIAQIGHQRLWTQQLQRNWLRWRKTIQTILLPRQIVRTAFFGATTIQSPRFFSTMAFAWTPLITIGQTAGCKMFPVCSPDRACPCDSLIGTEI